MLSLSGVGCSLTVSGNSGKGDHFQYAASPTGWPGILQFCNRCRMQNILAVQQSLAAILALARPASTD